MGAKAIKQGSWDKHPAYCLDWDVNVWHMRNGNNVMEYVKPGEEKTMFSAFSTGRVFLKSCVLGDRFHRIHVDGILGP